MRNQLWRHAAAATLFAGCATMVCGQETTNNWTGGAGDQAWFNPANWSLGKVPTADQTVKVNTGTNPKAVIAGQTAIADQLYVGYFKETGQVRLDAGAGLTAQELWVGRGNSAQGLFSQHGGQVSVGELNIGLYGSTSSSTTLARGEYRLIDGELIANALHMGSVSSTVTSGSGSFIQSGGVSRLGSVHRTNGLFELHGGRSEIDLFFNETTSGLTRLTGGELAVRHGLDLNALTTLDFGSGNAVVNVGENALVNLASTTIQNAEHAALHLGRHSILLLDAGVDPNTLFGGGFSTQGLIFTRDQDVVIPTDCQIHSAGHFVWQTVEVLGQLHALPGERFELERGVVVREGASVDLGSGFVRGGGSLTRGTLRGGYMEVTGDFVQDGGSLVMDRDLWVDARYELTGEGQLETHRLLIGVGNQGSMVQRNGRVLAHQSMSISDGQYELIDGELRVAGQMRIDWSGPVGRTYTQRGGVAHIGYLESWMGTDTLVPQISGGSMILDEGLKLAGVDFGGGDAAITVQEGIIDINWDKVTHVGSATLTTGPETVMVIDPGQDPHAVLGDRLNHQGWWHTRGSTMRIEAGRTLVANGRIDDPVSLAGTMRAGASIDPTDPNSQRLWLRQSMTIHDGGRLEMRGKTVYVENSRSLNTPGGNLLTVERGGEIRGGGKLDCIVTSSGTITLDAADPTLIVRGDFTQTSEGVLAIELGAEPKAALDLHRPAQLAGELQLTLEEGFVPDSDMEYLLLVSAGFQSGMFDNVIDGKLTFEGGTFDLIRRGMTLMDDYGYYYQFGQEIVLTNYQAVPEPGTLVMLGGLGAASLARRRRKAA